MKLLLAFAILGELILIGAVFVGMFGFFVALGARRQDLIPVFSGLFLLGIMGCAVLERLCPRKRPDPPA